VVLGDEPFADQPGIGYDNNQHHDKTRQLLRRAPIRPATATTTIREIIYCQKSRLYYRAV
jgi:hypothetical protein